MIYYFIGQPGAGKTTLAKTFKEYHPLKKFIHIDGDNMRDIFNNKDYSEDGRRKNIQLSHDIAKFLSNSGFNVIMSLVSPFKDLRDKLKEECNVIEIFVYTTEIRGREDYHVNEYQKPTEDFIEINTTNTPVQLSIGYLNNEITRLYGK
jgi:adenylylsulfate kinase-like enzyme